MELPNHLPRDNPDSFLTRTRVVDIGPYFNPSTPRAFLVTIQSDERCRPSFKITDGDYDISDDPWVRQCLIMAMFDQIVSLEDAVERAIEDYGPNDFVKQVLP